MNKKAVSYLKYSLLVSAFIVAVFLMYFAFATHVIRTSDGGTLFNVNEDVGFIYNISVNNTDAGEPANITQVNITIPASFTFTGLNGTDAVQVDFGSSSTVLSWSNLTGGYAVNGSYTTRYFWFNASAATPGVYNITITTLNATGPYSSNISVTVNDTTVPSVFNFVDPTDTTGANVSRNWLYINMTATDNGALSSILIRLYNSSQALINSSLSATSPASINFTGLADGTYYFNATANDTFNNINNSLTRIVTLDTVAPLVTLVSPANSTYNNATRLINITSAGTYTWFFNGTGNTTYTSEVYQTFAEGSNTVIAYTNDSVGNVNSTTRIFTADTIYPQINYGTGTSTDGINASRTWIYVNVSVTETRENTITFTLHNSTGQVNSTMLAAGARTINWTGLSNGVYTYNATVNDTAGNANTTSTYTIRLDTQNPLISYGVGTSDEIIYSPQTWIYVNVSVTEVNEKNITFELFNSSGIANSTTFTNGARTINWTGLSNGNYNYSVTIRDYTGNSNSTTVRLAYIKTYWVFNGTVYNTAGNVLNNTIVNMTIWAIGQQGPALTTSVATTSNASGWFSLNVPGDDNWMYRPVVRHFNSTNGAIDYIGQSLPQFPYGEFVNTSGLRFFLRDAGTINITVLNSTGTGRTVFEYMIKDTLLGYDVASNWQNYVTEAIIYVPRDRNYSIMIYPNQSLPVSYNWNNFTSGASYAFNYASSYNATTHTLQKTFNTTQTLATVTGQIRNSTNGAFAGGWDEFGIIAFLLEPGNMISKQYGAMPYNMSSWNGGASDVFNRTNGNYSITLPATAETTSYMLFATARNGTGYYGGYKNITLNYGVALNASFTMYPLMSTTWGQANENFTLNKATDWSPINISSAQQTINLVNVSNATLTNLNAHVETTLDYSSYGATQFTFMSGISTGSASRLYLPLLNVTGIKEINVYTQAYAPRRASLSVSEIIRNNNITLKAFDPGAIDDSIAAGQINIGLYISNASCDAPNPASPCVIGSSADEQSMDNFNPLTAIIGGGKISFRMGFGNITVHYADVDMLASGPPDAMFDSATSNSTSGDSFSSALRFGSQGPTIYSHVLVSIPYSEAAGSGLNDSAPVNLSIPLLYDDSWNVIWNASTNGTNAAGLAGNYTHYSNRQSEWAELLNTSACTTNVTIFNSTNPCYIDTTNNKIWVRLPHFSGTGPAAAGNVIPSATTTAASSSTSTGSSGGTAQFWTSTIYEDNKELSEMKSIAKELGAKARVIVKIKGAQHTVGVVSLASNSAVINVSSVSQQATLSVGESKKFDVEGDGYYDIKVALTKIVSSKASITVESINEKVQSQDTATPTLKDTSGQQAEQQRAPDSLPEDAKTKGSKSLWAWIIVLLVVLAILAGLLYKKRHSRLKRAGLK